MKTIYKVLLLLFATEFILALICGPHSCDWGNTVYFNFGILALLVCFFLPFFQKGWPTGKRIGYGFLFLFISLIVWCVGFMLGDFSIMCRLF